MSKSRIKHLAATWNIHVQLHARTCACICIQIYMLGPSAGISIGRIPLQRGTRGGPALRYPTGCST